MAEDKILGVDLKTKEPKKEEVKTTPKVVETPKEVKEDGNSLYIENLEAVQKRVAELEAEKEFNPSAIQDGDEGVAILGGRPMKIIDNEYVPVDDADIILQTRKVVSEYNKLQKLIKK